MAFQLIEHAFAIVGWYSLGYYFAVVAWTISVYALQVPDPDTSASTWEYVAVTLILILFGPIWVILTLYYAVMFPEGWKRFLRYGLYTPARFVEVKANIHLEDRRSGRPSDEMSH